MTTTATPISHADYYDLCDRARAAGVIVDLANPRSPRTVDDLMAAVVAAEENIAAQAERLAWDSRTDMG